MYGIADAWFTLDAEAPRIAAIGAICARAIVSPAMLMRSNKIKFGTLPGGFSLTGQMGLLVFFVLRSEIPV